LSSKNASESGEIGFRPAWRISLEKVAPRNSNWTFASGSALSSSSGWL
jgi:hypothetical protein